LKFRTIAEIVGIIGVIIAFLEYAKIEPNALDKIPEIYREKAEAAVKSSLIVIDPNNYKDKEDLYNLYRAAMAMDDGHSKDLQIKKVVDIALRKGDFKIAISSANAIDSDHTKSMELSVISQKALNIPEQSGYAVIAAELIPSSHTKGLAIGKIVQFYEVRAKGGKPGQLSNIEKYKTVYRFADSSVSMGNSAADAKAFADSWFLKRSYDDFLLFKEVFTFADSTAYMDMSEENAEVFAFKWIDNYTADEFYMFKDTFTFADSSAGMSMDEKQAELFAFKKVHEHRAEIKANTPSKQGAVTGSPF
jgi:hypothetical protein